MLCDIVFNSTGKNCRTILTAKFVSDITKTELVLLRIKFPFIYKTLIYTTPAISETVAFV